MRKDDVVRNATDNLDAALDAALDMTFPASDPVALFIPAAEPPLLAEPPLNSTSGHSPVNSDSR